MVKANFMKICAISTLFILAGLFFTVNISQKATAQSDSTQVIRNFIDSLEPGTADSYKNVKIYPVISSNQISDSFMLLDEAVNNGTIEIKEKGSGDVNNLEVYKNSSKEEVFIMAGEIIKGAKQDRIIKNDLILGKNEKKYVIPVYCVEQGRWTKKTDKFDSAKMLGASQLRSKVTQGKAQSEVWSEVTSKNKSMGASSSTSNYRASYESKVYKEEASNYVNHYISLPDKNSKYVGVILIIDNKIANADIFGNHNTFKELWPKIIKSYAQDAVDDNFAKNIANSHSPDSLLKRLKTVTYEEISNPGLGNEYTFSDSNFSGNLLKLNNKVVHLATFANSKGAAPIDYFRNQSPQQIQYEQIPNMRRRTPNH